MIYQLSYYSTYCYPCELLNRFLIVFDFQLFQTWYGSLNFIKSIPSKCIHYTPQMLLLLFKGHISYEFKFNEVICCQCCDIRHGWLNNYGSCLIGNHVCIWYNSMHSASPRLACPKYPDLQLWWDHYCLGPAVAAKLTICTAAIPGWYHNITTGMPHRSAQ